MYLIRLSFLFSAFIAQSNQTEITCGSVVKLTHFNSGFKLHSHQINWGSGSGQQSVTANESNEDQGELFLVKESDGSIPCEAGSHIICGSIIRLEHVLTKKNLHTHNFTSPLSRLQEVSAFGEEGDGDSGDNWILHCNEKNAQYWFTDSKIYLQSPNSGKYLYSSSSAKFTQANCPHCPIVGQQEVSAHSAMGDNIYWIVQQGLFLNSSH